eukprot:TRINITY_DN3099_c0_g1_i8.p1 TRINITY_DN3099_c0_g1~~TRINITY_DN3099_c0_g1_i8.p1  ORF type:complete len:380 (+),score=32.00 TRINITY_DN3099_c0_g1_i8:38-1177(+)
MASILEDFRHEVTSVLGAKNSNLIRTHDKNFGSTGDFSFPRLDNKKVWGHPGDLSENDLEDALKKVESMKILRLSHGEKSVYLWIDRQCAFRKYFSSNFPLKKESQLESNHVVNKQDSDKKDLTCERVNIYSDMLQKMLSKVSGGDSTLKFEVGTKKVLDKSDDVRYISVGPVLGQNGKKESASLDELFRKVYDALESQDCERRDESENESDREARLRALTKAQIHFMLTSSVPSAQVKLDLTGRSAVFLLYNCARIVQILYSFEESVRDGVYPPINEENIDFGLLDTQEEWELFFVYILPYTDVLQEAVHMGKLHKLPLHLIGLSNCLSRYYSRVKILRDPLPSLVPTLHARIQFIKHIHAIILDGLDVMGLQPLNKL